MFGFLTQRGRFLRPAILALFILVGLFAAEPALADVNLTFAPTAGWSYPVVPHDYNTSSEISCLIPATLFTYNAYWNAHGENTGSDPTPGGFDVAYYVDGSLRELVYAPATGGDFFILNQGPGSYIEGGRHTIYCYVDAFHSIVESNETDNYWGRQFTGLAPLLPADHSTWQPSAPPPRTGGWDYITDGSTPRDNFSGYLAYTGAAVGQAIVMGPVDAGDDYDLRLFLNEDNSSTAEFETPLEISNRGAGLLDVIFMFGHRYTMYQAAVVNMNGGDGDYIAFREIDYYADLNDIKSVPLYPDLLLFLHRHFTDAGEAGWTRATVQTDPGEILHVARFQENGDAYATLDDADDTVTTDANGTAVLNFLTAELDRQFVAVYRNPQEARETTLNYTIVFELMDPVADLEPAGQDWWSPLVPTPTQQTSDPVGLPSSLPGNAASTYHNFQFRNDGYAGTGVMNNRIYLDGAGSIPILYLGGVPAQTTSSYHASYTQTVRGGRHTLGVVYDINNNVTEIDETNNSYGEQFCWTPLNLTYGSTVTRAAPPSPLATTELIPDGVTIYPNCDGLRLPEINLSLQLNGWWRGAAAMPAAADDVRLALHRPSTGPKIGFSSASIVSDEAAGQLEYALVNFHEVTNNDFDVGLQRGVSCIQDVAVEAVSSTRMSLGGQTSFGPYLLPANHALDVLDIFLTPGLYAFQVDNLTGSGRLGLALHDAAESYVSCRDGVVPGGRDEASSGESAHFSVNLTAAGYYGLATWKPNSADLSLSITYRLRIVSGVSGVEDPPSATSTGLVEAFPNPFNPRTRLVYEVLKEQDISIAVYDVKGRLVSTLWDGPQVPGRHEVLWDGTDKQGSAMASGVYLARMMTREGVTMRHLTLVR
jgi:FlgD Ig-like domain/CARDB